MLDLAFLILMIIVIVKANRGEISDKLCTAAFVIGMLAGAGGILQLIFSNKSGVWQLNIVVMLIALVLRRVAKRFAKLYNDKIEKAKDEYNALRERYPSLYDDGKEPPNFDDPNTRFSGGNGGAWQGK